MYPYSHEDKRQIDLVDSRFGIGLALSRYAAPSIYLLPRVVQYFSTNIPRKELSQIFPCDTMYAPAKQPVKQLEFPSVSRSTTARILVLALDPE